MTEGPLGVMCEGNGVGRNGLWLNGQKEERLINPQSLPYHLITLVFSFALFLCFFLQNHAFSSFVFWRRERKGANKSQLMRTQTTLSTPRPSNLPFAHLARFSFKLNKPCFLSLIPFLPVHYALFN